MNAVDGAVRKALSTLNSNTSAETHFLNSLKPEDRPKAEAQLMLQKQQEVTAFISNMLKKLHEISMSVINNIK
ncbi:hypothetical protein [Pyxidicoccus sp. MSG2]|uniref:hypothetical protein n=1 Tax=Pyxidicoccus sp. MSG2 TaxID=2996790 RepID=UPI00226E0714|nr:hypothetical protein [Pyxidicoccus sp. MSG2]MCY1022180.1 hypothetical protein [Pyxidicoccus sp. MSG2]